MEKEFVPYELAVKLKVLGFDEPCLAFYNGKHLDLGVWDWEYPAGEKRRNIGQCPSAPTFSAAFRWFREKYNIQATVEPTKDQHRFELGFNYWIWNTKTAEEWFTEPRDRPAGDYVFETYEEAELACLDKLIEIVENK